MTLTWIFIIVFSHSHRFDIKMSIHICDRNTCNTKAVSGPKINCVECEKECFLLCYGFLKCGEKAVKLPLLHGACIGMDPNVISFTCASCDNVLIDDAVTYKMDSMNQVPKPNQTTQETQTIFPNTTMIRIADELADLKSVVYELKSKMDDSHLKPVSNSNLSALSDSNKIVSANNKVNPTFADVLRSDRKIRTPKRNKDAMSVKRVADIKLRPPSKVGTRPDDDNLVVVANVVSRPMLKHSIYVSRVSTTVTPDKMISYVEKHTDMKKNINFKCSLLVKKDADLNNLTFVSYKIDVTDEFMDQLMQESFWPKGIQIRLFVPKERKSTQIGDFLNLSENEPLHPSKILRGMSEENGGSQANAVNAQVAANTEQNGDLMDFQTLDQHIKND